MYRIFILIALLAGCSDCTQPSNNGGDDAGTDAAQIDMDSDEQDDGGGGDTQEPFDPADLGWGLHVVGRDASDIYVAGGNPDQGTLLHYDGEEWSKETLPDGTPLLNWVHPFDDGTTLAVGNGGTVLIDDGSGWAVQETPTEQDLWGVWGASPDDVWAVGGAGRSEGQDTIIRWNGSEWTEVEPPALERPGVNAYFKVWGSGADDVWIVGQNGIVLHWDGEMLEEDGVGTSRDLIALSGTGPDDIIIVGGRSNGVISHYDGTEWTTEELSPAPGLNGIFMLAPGEFWVAGVRGLLRRGTVDQDGFDVPRTRPVSAYDLHAVWGTDGYGLLAVGGNFEMQQGPYEGAAILREDEWN
jgi:hypothetical protein